MLELYFCNVGDGDAILLRELSPGRPDYTVLIDTGRPFVEPQEGSFRKEAIYHLLARGVRRIDRLILTHPHIDHVGGTLRVLRHIPVGRITMLTVPPAGAAWLAPSRKSTHKRVNGFKHLMNITAEIADAAREKGIPVEEAKSGTEQLTERLAMTTYLPRKTVAAEQRAVCEHLFAGGKVKDEVVAMVSTDRNLASLMHRFDYAGRSILLTGDRYAEDWEHLELPRCDVLKLPHHGDPKSVTEPLLQKLKPRIAVISTQSEPLRDKARPSEGTLRLLRKYAGSVYCTENRVGPSMAAATYNGICVTIGEDGSMDCRTE